MFLKRFFNTTQVDEFAQALVGDFVQRFPLDATGQAPKGGKKLAAAIQNLNQRADQFNREHNIGLYKKAKLSNALKWGLKERGYPDDLIDEVIKGMLFAMARKK